MKYTKKDVGCYIDGVNGIYVGQKIQKIAFHHGCQNIICNDPESLEYDDATEEAINYMNENFSVNGCYWGWNDGDFGLYLMESE